MTFGISLPPIVVDASVAIEFLSGDTSWQQAFENWADEDRLLLGPAHLLAEVANGQLRGQRLSGADVSLRIDRIVAAGLELTDRGVYGLLEAIQLAERHGLTVYDALYLQLALDIEGELATLDADLRRAAEAEGLFVADPAAL